MKRARIRWNEGRTSPSPPLRHKISPGMTVRATHLFESASVCSLLTLRNLCYQQPHSSHSFLPLPLRRSLLPCARVLPSFNFPSRPVPNRILRNRLAPPLLPYRAGTTIIKLFPASLFRCRAVKTIKSSTSSNRKETKKSLALHLPVFSASYCSTTIELYTLS